MKAETQIGAAVLIFFSGWFVGQTLQSDQLPNPEWVNAVVNTLLLLAAVYGIRRGFAEWQRQFVAHRDHDLAIKLFAALSKVNKALNEFRTPTGMLSDLDVPVAPPETMNDPESYRQYEMYVARYRARQMHLVAAVEERQAVVSEVLHVWGALGTEIGSLVNVLAGQEGMVVHEAHKFVEKYAIFYEGAVEEVDSSILFAPADATAEDVWIMVYDKALEKVSELVQPKVRMLIG